MDGHNVDQRQRTEPAPARAGSWFSRLLAERSVRIAVVAWIAAYVVVLLLARGHLPFHRPSQHGVSYGNQVTAPILALVEVLLLIAVVYALTRRRVVPDVAARAPERATALRETLWMIGYAVAALLGGLVLGLALGWHPFSFHLVGTLYGTDDTVLTVCWERSRRVATCLAGSPFAASRRT